MVTIMSVYYTATKLNFFFAITKITVSIKFCCKSGDTCSTHRVYNRVLSSKFIGLSTEGRGITVALGNLAPGVTLQYDYIALVKINNHQIFNFKEIQTISCPALQPLHFLKDLRGRVSLYQSRSRCQNFRCVYSITFIHVMLLHLILSLSLPHTIFYLWRFYNSEYLHDY